MIRNPTPEMRAKLVKAKRQKLVEEALKIIGAGPEHAEDIERRVLSAMGFVMRQKAWRQSGRYGVQTKVQKAAAKRFAAALRRLEGILKDPNLPSVLTANFPLDKIEFEVWLKCADEAAGTKLEKPKPSNPAKLVAARQAARLLEKYDGGPLRRSRQSNFHKLTAVLYGDKNEDCYEACRAWLDQTETG